MCIEYRNEKSEGNGEIGIMTCIEYRIEKAKSREEDEDIIEALSARRGFEAREYPGKRGTNANESFSVCRRRRYL